jgi:transposase
VASYLGLVPLEKSSGNRRRLGHITKQGSSLLRFLLVEAAQVTVRSAPEWRSQYFRMVMRRGRKTAKVAMARRLAIHLYWMWREDYDIFADTDCRFTDSVLMSHPTLRPIP